MKTTEVMESTMGHFDRNNKRTTSDCRVVYQHCFRCAETGSMSPSRLQTNTYIPSFQLPRNLVAQASSLVPSKYGDLISSTGHVRIYVQTLLDLLPFFAVSHPLGIIYQPAKIKNTMSTLSSPNGHKKRNPEYSATDNGQYASLHALKEAASENSCPWDCIEVRGGPRKGLGSPLFQGGGKNKERTVGTKLDGKCTPCRVFFDNFPRKVGIQPTLTTLSKSIIKDGLPAGFSGVANYPDEDGSPRIGRPFDNGTAVEMPDQPDWNKQIGSKPPSTSPPSTSPPSKAPSPTKAPGSPADGACLKLDSCIDGCPSKPARFKQCVMKCQGKAPPEGDIRPTRRRRGGKGGGRRRRKAGFLQALIDEVASQHEQM